MKELQLLEKMSNQILDVRTGGEYREAMQTKPIVKVLNSGLQHEHSFKTLPWGQHLGSSVTSFKKHTATFKSRVGCEESGCDYEAIVSERALY